MKRTPRQRLKCDILDLKSVMMYFLISLPTVPDRSPEVPYGAYVVDGKDCANNQRNITIYWKVKYSVRNGV